MSVRLPSGDDKVIELAAGGLRYKFLLKREHPPPKKNKFPYPVFKKKAVILSF
jgi:hypothetical protein